MKPKTVLIMAALISSALLSAGITRAEKGAKTAEEIEQARRDCQAHCENTYPCSKLRPQQCDARLTCINTCNELAGRPPSGGPAE